jgi:hydrophobic/amphiphilic exporter-1 (mainly G- bacteria), HAE1 family
VPTGFFSATTNERLRINYEFADFAFKSDGERAVSQVESFLWANAERFLVKGVYSYYQENEAGTTISLARPDLSDREVQELRTELRAALPRIPGVRLSFDDDSAEQGGSSTFFAVKLFGQDSEVLGRLAEEAERRLATVEEVEDITSPIHRGRREIQVTVDRDRATRLGLTAQDVSNLFSFTLGGMRLRQFNAGDHEVETWLALRQEDRTSLEDLKRIHVANTASSLGTPVMLGDIASFQMVRREQEIQRENRKVKTEVKAVYEGQDWDRSKERIAALMNAFDLPPGYSWSWDDRILEQDGQGQQMAVNFLLALALVYLVMAALFESLAQPFAILFSIPFALPGAIWLLAATRTPFNMMAQIGLLLLMGVVVNNGIVLLDHLNQLRKAGMPRDEAIIQAGRDRLRPVLMTALTTLLGLLPLAIGGAAVSDLFYYPLARTVMGGLISSSVLTLIVLPYITLGVEGFAAWLRGLWAGSAPTARDSRNAAVAAHPVS